MQGVPEGIEFNEVYDFIKGVKGVVSVHNLHIWAVNSNNSFLSCHVCINKSFENKTDDIIKEINNLLEEKYLIRHTTIQIEKDNICKSGYVCNK